MVENIIKTIMRKFPNGVAIATTSWKDTLFGMTVNTFNSLSLNPPLIYFVADKTVSNDIPFRESDYFAINLVDNVQILDLFAREKNIEERFRKVKFRRGIGNIPILEESYAYFEAQLYDVVDEGDHAIIVGKVLSGTLIREPKPVVYYDRGYHFII
ncbi:MAG: flavin reductase family protein [Sulfolobaceae archaeon]|nr:flavin reductase family protein [Sulfolobaceae archaeon]